MPASDRVYAVKTVLANRTRWRKALAPTYVGSRPEGDTFDVFVGDVHALMPKTVDYDVLRQSLMYLCGETVTREALDQACWRLAGNLKRLTRGDVVTPWTRQPYPEWVPAQIVSAKRRRDARFRAGFRFEFQVLAGYAAGLRTTKFWTDKQCGYVSSVFGFNNRYVGPRSRVVPRNQFQYGTEFVSLRLSVLVEPRLCSTNEPGFDRTRVGTSSLDWNRAIMALRDRREDVSHCKMDLSVLCHQCPFGYRSCPAATHRNDYEFRFCDACSRERAPYDKDVSTEVCVQCFERRLMSRRQ